MVKIPFVIDNENDEKKMSNILNNILSDHEDRSLDIASAYFNVHGYELIKEGLNKLSNFRLLLGHEPHAGEDIGLKPNKKLLLQKMRGDLEQLPFTEETLLLVENLIRFLQQNHVDVGLYEHGFLHSKAYLFYNDKQRIPGTWDRYQPKIGIVGSSNFTRGGLYTNKELNLVHKATLSNDDINRVVRMSAKLSEVNAEKEKNLDQTSTNLMSAVGATAIDELSEWYEQHWKEARPFKEELVNLLDASKFGEYPYTPYQIYMKTLFTYLKDDLDSDIEDYKKSIIDLAEFQEDAVKKARKILLKYNGVMIADSVGLGKTWIAKKLLEDYAYHMRMKALVITPASLQQMWKKELTEASISATYLSQEILGRPEFDPTEFGDADVIVIDESHNFRNPNSSRYERLERIISMNGGKGKSNERKIVILLTATPINNDLFDLYNQLCLITQNQKDYFSAAAIGDLRKYFLNARRDSDRGATINIFNLLEEIVIRRSRHFIKKAYPKATIKGKEIRWPERKLKTLDYSLEESYTGIYKDIVNKIENLYLTPYSLEYYKKTGVEQDDMEKGREQALVAIFKTRFLKRFESSVHAFRISIKRTIQFLKTFEDYLLDEKLLDSSSFRALTRFTETETEEDDSTPSSITDILDSDEAAKKLVEELPNLDITKYNLKKIHQSIRNDIDSLDYIWNKIKDISTENDSKLQALKHYLKTEFKGKKLLIFSYYKDTERYIYNYFTSTEGGNFLRLIGNPNISRLDSDFSPTNRRRRIQQFSPKANDKPQISGTEEEIDIMFSTDVLSEGQNLQDCGHLLNYDLHWNPTRMVQRAGRIDRIGTDYEILNVYNFFPEDKLEELLQLVGRLNSKIQSIDSTGFLDASILGEVPHPKSFNTLRKIREEDGTVFEEEEQFVELASNEMLQRILIEMLQKDGKEKIEDIPDGVHSGRRFADKKGIFFYFTLEKKDGGTQHFWKCYDLRNKNTVSNRFIIANYISCERDEERVIPEGIDIFKVQEEIKKEILKDLGEIRSLEEAPKKIEKEQQTVITILQEYLNNPDINRQDLIKILRGLERPLAKVYIKKMREAYKKFTEDENIMDLLTILKNIISEVGMQPRVEKSEDSRDIYMKKTSESDLHLICFEYIS